MTRSNHTYSSSQINPNNPATWLKPDEPLMVNGLDWSWCYVWFKDTVDLPGYKIGFDGSVWSCKKTLPVGPRGQMKLVLTNSWCKINPFAEKRGRLYIDVGSRRKGKRKRHAIHKLVLEAFIGKCPNGLEGCHNDGNVKNNSLPNLRWDTHQSNIDDCVKHGVLPWGSHCKKSKLTDDQVAEIRLLRALGEKIVDLGIRYGVHSSHISRIANNKMWVNPNQRKRIPRGTTL